MTRPLGLYFAGELPPRPAKRDTRSPFEYGRHLGYDGAVQCERCPEPLHGSRRFCDTHRREHAAHLVADLDRCRHENNERLERLRAAGWLGDDGLIYPTPPRKDR